MLTFRLAYRNILRQRRRSILTGLSIAISYLVCCLAISMSEGSYNNAIRFFTEDSTGHIQIHSGDYLHRPNIHKHFSPDEFLQVMDDDRIAAASARVFAPGLAYAGDNHAPAQIVGIDVISEPQVSRIRDKVTAGQFLTSSWDVEAPAPAMIGVGIAEQLEISPGGELILISQGADGSIANDIFTVTGVVGTRNSSDRFQVYLPLTAAQEFLTLNGRAHQIAIRLNRISHARTVASDLHRVFDEPSITISPWQEVQESFFRSMESDKRATEISLGIILFIVFIGVLNTVLMSVLERTREFGVLKAIGSRPGNVARLIVLETSMITFLGLIVGLVLTLPLIWWFATIGINMPEPIDVGGVKMQAMRGEFSWDVFIFPTVIVYAYALLISVFPAIKAARVSPIDAMRST